MPKITENYCHRELSKKIKKNIQEFPLKQAIAVSFSQTKKKYPKCGKFLKKK